MSVPQSHVKMGANVCSPLLMLVLLWIPTVANARQDMSASTAPLRFCARRGSQIGQVVTPMSTNAPILRALMVIAESPALILPLRLAATSVTAIPDIQAKSATKIFPAILSPA